MPIALYTLTSPLHSEAIRPACEEAFIQDIERAMGEKFAFRADDFSDYGTFENSLIYIRTGGTEGLFKELNLQGEIRLLASGSSNSLAAAMEILSYLRSRGQKGEILHGSPSWIAGRMTNTAFIRKLQDIDIGGIRIGVIGKPSDWLISSDVDYAKAKSRLNVELIDIPMQELVDKAKTCTCEGSEAIYEALREIIAEYNLGGLTIRCFDLLDTLHNTGCLALARLNSEGIPAACEGDIPALLSMAYLQKTKGCPGFQCNLSRIDGDELLFAHCTVPLSMTTSYKYMTHFESGIGTAIKGEMPLCEVEIFKISPDLEHFVSIPGRIIRNSSEKNLCRTQIVVKAPGAADYFLRTPLANHHIVSYLP